MSAEKLLDIVLAGEGALLLLFIKHMFDCRGNSGRLTRIEQFLKDKMGYDE